MPSTKEYVMKLDYPCPTCDDSFDSKRAVADHHKDKHNTKITKAQVRRVRLSKEQFKTLLESIYAINRYAKKYSKSSQDCYDKGDKPKAKKNSLRKDALYALKAKLLDLIYQNSCYDDLEKHKINGDLYWLMRVDNWEFHMPQDDFTPNQDDITLGGDEPVDLSTFQSHSNQNHADKPLKSALIDIHRITGISANDFLSEVEVRLGIEKEYIGWEYISNRLP